MNADKRHITATLKGARSLLSDPGSWTKTANARETSGRLCHPLSEHAVCWCLLGAVCRVADDKGPFALPDRLLVSELKKSAIEQFSGRFHTTLEGFNDHPKTTHDDILKLIDATVARLEKEEKGDME